MNVDFKKLFALTLAGAVMAGCVHTGTSTQQTAVEQEQTSTQTREEEALESESTGLKNSVTYSDSGFSPQVLTVEQGMTVTFVNRSSRGMWVASVVHPTHEVLPGFDQLSAGGNGTSYSYSFERTGEWKYHNHVFPGDTGTIIVE